MLSLFFIIKLLTENEAILAEHFQKQALKVFYKKKMCLKYFAKFTGKRLVYL